MVPEPPTGRISAGSPRPGNLPIPRLLIVLLLSGCLMSLGALAYAGRMQQAWMSGVFDDATSADTPATAVEIVALPCVSTGLSCPSPVVGSVPSGSETGRSAAPAQASRTRAPPLA